MTRSSTGSCSSLNAAAVPASRPVIPIAGRAFYPVSDSRKDGVFLLRSGYSRSSGRAFSRSGCGGKPAFIEAGLPVHPHRSKISSFSGCQQAVKRLLFSDDSGMVLSRSARIPVSPLTLLRRCRSLSSFGLRSVSSFGRPLFNFRAWLQSAAVIIPALPSLLALAVRPHDIERLQFGRSFLRETAAGCVFPFSILNRGSCRAGVRSLGRFYLLSAPCQTSTLSWAGWCRYRRPFFHGDKSCR